MLLKNCIGLKPDLILAGENICTVGWFCYLCICVSPNGYISDKMSSRKEKSRLAWNLLIGHRPKIYTSKSNPVTQFRIPAVSDRYKETVDV